MWKLVIITEICRNKSFGITDVQRWAPVIDRLKSTPAQNLRRHNTRFSAENYVWTDDWIYMETSVSRQFIYSRRCWGFTAETLVLAVNCSSRQCWRDFLVAG
jgi:hypothetical protein